jgi:hypothetical protein
MLSLEQLTGSNKLASAPKNIIINKSKYWPRFTTLGIRCLLAGRSGSGKTTALANILTLFATYTHLILVVKDAYDPAIKVIIDYLETISKMCNTEIDQLLTVHNDINDLPPPAELDDHQKIATYIVFDDCQTYNKEGLKKMEEYFTYGRHFNVSSICLYQTYYACPKTIRENCNCYAIFKTTSIRHLRLMYDEFASVDFKTFEQFANMFDKATSRKGQFLFIDNISRDLLADRLIDNNKIPDYAHKYRISLKMPIKIKK